MSVTRMVAPAAAWWPPYATSRSGCAFATSFSARCTSIPATERNDPLASPLASPGVNAGAVNRAPCPCGAKMAQGFPNASTTRLAVMPCTPECPSSRKRTMAGPVTRAACGKACARNLRSMDWRSAFSRFSSLQQVAASVSDLEIRNRNPTSAQSSRPEAAMAGTRRKAIVSASISPSTSAAKIFQHGRHPERTRSRPRRRKARLIRLAPGDSDTQSAMVATAT